MDIFIRVAEMDDVPALRGLIPLAARELSKGFYTPEQAESASEQHLCYESLIAQQLFGGYTELA